MFTKRIIPCLDVKDGRVVKGVNFVDLKDAGDPVEIAAAYDKAGADEVVFLDITASSDHRATVVDMVRKVAADVFIPFTVGGGIRSVDQFFCPNPSGTYLGSGRQVWQPMCSRCHRCPKACRRQWLECI